MAVNLRALVPDGTTNYITNPSLRYDTTGYTAVGSVISRTLEKARFNIASLEVDTNGLSLYEGCYFRVSDLEGISEPITASAYVRGPGIARIRLIDNPSGKEWHSQPISLTDRWTRLSVSGYSTGSDDLRVYVETDQRAQDVVLYVDGVQLERKAYPTTFCDGDQPGCRWTGVYHSSSSSRTPYTRQGGRWVDLAGPCRADDNIYVTMAAGMGMAPKSSQKQSWALEPGSYFQNAKVLDRRIVLTFHVKNPRRVLSRAPDSNPLHHLRQQLLDVLKPDRTYDSEDVLFEYQAGDKPVYFRARYETGLDGEWDIRNQWINSFAVALSVIAGEFFEDNYEVQSLNFLKNYPQISGKRVDFLGRINGEWFPISIDGSGYELSSHKEFCLVRVGLNGEVYVANDDSVYMFDGSTMTKIGTVVNGNFLGDMAISPVTGDLYISGEFDSIDGVLCRCIARWDGTWHALGSLSSGGSGGALAFTPDGKLYAGYSETFPGGVEGIGWWDGSAWHSVGYGVTSEPFTIVYDPVARCMYMCGSFTSEKVSGQSLLRVAKIDLETNLLSPLGDGLSATVYSLAVDRDGTLYAGGAFLTDGDGDVTIQKVAYWNGQAWFQLGEGASSVSQQVIRHMRIGPDGNLYLAGSFQNIGYSNNKGFTGWFGDRRGTGKFAGLDLLNYTDPPNGYILGFDISKNGDMFVVGGDNTVDDPGFIEVGVAALNTVNYTGTTKTCPTIYIKGPGNLHTIENQSVGVTLRFNLNILADEEVTIDCAKGSITSTVRGDLSYGVVSISSLTDFVLVPGDNRIAAFMTRDVVGKMQIGFTPKHHGVDATAMVGALA